MVYQLLNILQYNQLVSRGKEAVPELRQTIFSALLITR